MEHTPKEYWPRLSPGTLVGDWRVEAWQGQGASGAVYRALRVGTPAYLPAQAWLFHLRSAPERDSYYPPSPADDLYALGVTAYRLAMGQYPPPINARQDEGGSWHVASPDPRPLLENNPRVQPLLREWILRLLSDAPEVRGTATQLAEALEAAADEKVPELQPAAQPAAAASPPNAPTPAGGGVLPERPRSLSPVRASRPWLALAAAGICAVLLWSVQPVPVPCEHLSQSTPQASGSQAPDAGTAAVGDTSPTEPQASTHPPAEPKPIAQEPPPEPHPRQARPDKKGRCPGRKQVILNGGCWVEQPSMSPEECAENGYVLLKGKCFASALAPPRKPLPTSSPAKPR